MDLRSEHIDIVIYVALKEEFDDVKKDMGKGFKPLEIPDVAITCFLGQIHSDVLNYTFNVVMVPGGKMGNTRSSNIMSTIVDRYKPSDVVVLGIAGSLSNDLQPGDVFIPDQVNEYLANSAAVGEKKWSFQTSGNHFNTAPRLINRFQLIESTQKVAYDRWRRMVKKNRSRLIDDPIRQSLQAAQIEIRSDCRLYVGDDKVLASGPAVGKGQAFVDWLRTEVDRKVVAMEMETAGVYDVALIRTPAPRAIAIRGISDFADERKKRLEDAAKDRFRTLAVKNAVALLVNAIQGGLFKQDVDPSLGRVGPSPPRPISTDDQEVLTARYDTALRQQHGHVFLGGTALRLEGQLLYLPLDELYVVPSAEAGVHAVPQTQFIMSTRQGYQAIRTGSVSLVSLNDIKSARQAVVLGMPGAGKSTLLHWLILEVLQTRAAPGPGRSRQPFPIFVQLPHVAQALQQQPTLTLDHYLRQRHLVDYQSLIQQALDNGRVWLLMDGLDEVVERHMRRQLSNAIEIFVAQFPNVERVVVTSRVVGYRAAQLSDTFRHFTLQPFGLPEITLFVENWFKVVYRLTQPSPDYGEAGRRTSRLLEGLKDKPRVLQLAGTPLFLTLIVLMDWKGKEIPRRRVELYETAIRTLLEDWPASHGRPVQDELTMDEMLRVLAQLGLEIFTTSSEAAIRQDDLENRLAAQIRAVRDSSKSEAAGLAKRWLPLLSEHSGLLQDAGVDTFNRPVYTFLHLSFAEYLCGRALASQWRAGGIDLAYYANDSRWHEVLLLMAGYVGMDYSAQEATRLVETIQAIPFSHQDVLYQPLVLVATCLADDVPLLDDFRERLVEQLVLVWFHSPPSRLKSRLFRLLGAMRGTDSAPVVMRQVVPWLEHGDVHARSSIVELLGNLAGPADAQLRDRLLAALGDPAVEVQRSAVRTLGMFDLAAEPDVRGALLEALHHPNPGVRARAVAALGPLAASDQAVTQALLNILAGDSHNEPRLMAARMLGATRRPGLDVLAALGAAILDGDKATRKEAITGYRSWDTHSRRHILMMMRAALRDPAQERRRKTLELIAEISLVLRDDARDLLLEVVKGDANSDVPLLVPLIKALGSLPTASDEVLRLLLTNLQHEHPQVRITSAKALGDLGVRDQAVTQELTAALSSSNTSLRKAAAAALGTCGTPQQATISALEQALFDADEFVGLNAAQSLLRLGVQRGKVQERLAALLQSENAEKRLVAVQAVHGIVRTLAPSVIAVLVERVSDSYRNVSEHALRVLSELGHEAKGEVITACRAALTHSYYAVRACAAEALGRIGRADEETITALLSALTDQDDRVRLAASSALTTLGQGDEHEMIVHHVRAMLDGNPGAEGVFNTLWDLVVGE